VNHKRHAGSDNEKTDSLNRRKLQTHSVNSDYMDGFCSKIPCKLTGQQQAQIDRPITEIDLRQEILQVAGKVVGSGWHLLGIHPMGMGSYQNGVSGNVQRDVSGRAVTKEQETGFIVCTPKSQAPAQETDYRQITLLNSDYKIYSRILANRLRTTFSGLLHRSQHCAASGTTICVVTSGLRNIIAHGGMRARGLCLLALDFTSAFDRLSHR
jgi:hypothetical protein